MSHDHDHSQFMQEVEQEYSEILADSDQAIYIFLDDSAKICNKKFSDLLGYESAQAWSEANGSFTDLFVDDASQRTLVGSYQEAMQSYKGSTNTIVWKKKDGSTVNTQVILVPIVYKGHLLAMHFVEKM